MAGSGVFHGARRWHMGWNKPGFFSLIGDGVSQIELRGTRGDRASGVTLNLNSRNAGQAVSDRG
jgi:hypothetical protein